jgi:hypothetical protein
MSVTDDTFQFNNDELKIDALLKVAYMSVTFPTFHRLMSSLNDVWLANNEFKLVIRDVSHPLMCP